MSDSQMITRRIGSAEITLPVDDAFEAWFKQQFGKSIKVGRDIPRPGETVPGEGGVFAGFGPKEDGSLEWLIAAPIDIGYFKDLAYGEYGKEVSGAQSWYDGRANTAALLAHGDHPAARKCAEFAHEGHSDYFLGAKLQMAAVFAALYGKVPKEWFLTSTQYSASSAWYQGFGTGNVNGWIKNAKAGVLPLRSVSYF